MIGDETLEVASYGFLGMHNSSLPKYRGGSPLVWTMINGEKQAGLSLFSFTKGIDEGDIWAQESVEIGPDDYIADILMKLEAKAIALLREKYLDILNGKLKPVPQNHNLATYCAMRIPEDGLIDWHKPSQGVYNFIRAQSDPYPGAFTISEGKKLIIWRAHPSPITYYGTPGQVARISPDGVYVICGDNTPLICDFVELDGKKDAASKTIKSIKTRLGR
jgi:methionyl-tRNA formyltransferase